MNITKQQIINLKNAQSKGEVDNLLKIWFPDALKPKLEVGKWYISGTDCLFNYQEVAPCYGFMNNEWGDVIINTEAPIEEASKIVVNEWLRIEASKRYPVGALVNFHNGKNALSEIPPSNKYAWGFTGDSFVYGGGVVLKNRLWAKTAPELANEYLKILNYEFF